GVRDFGLEADPGPEVYRPYGVNPLGAPILVVRTRGDAAAMLPGLSAKVRAVHPEIPTYNEFVMESLVARSTVQRRFVMLLLTGFAAAAMLLAGLGISGCVDRVVGGRSHGLGGGMAGRLSTSGALGPGVGGGGRPPAVRGR